MRARAIARVLSVVVVSVSCGEGDSLGTGPTGPSSGASTIAIVGNSGGQSFSPNPASVGGQMANWRNNHDQTHRIVANDGSFDTGNIAPGNMSPPLALPSGGINYHCSIHPTMIGAIGGAGGAAPPPCDGLYC